MTKRRFCVELGTGMYDCMFFTSDVAVSGPFEITQSNCAEFGGGCSVWVKFKPTRRGRQDGFLRLDSDPVVGVPLTGKGCREYDEKLRCKPKK